MAAATVAVLLGYRTYHQSGQASELMDTQFLNFMSAHQKSYGTRDEFEFRRSLFSKLDVQIQEWNARENETHKLGHN